MLGKFYAAAGRPEQNYENSGQNGDLPAYFAVSPAKFRKIPAKVGNLPAKITSSYLSVSFQLYRSVLYLSRNQKKASLPITGSWLRWHLIWHVPSAGAWQCY